MNDTMHDTTNTENHPQWIRLPQVMERVKMGKTWVYARMADPVDPFPAAIRLSRRCVVWDEKEVSAWMKRQTDRVSARQTEARSNCTA